MVSDYKLDSRATEVSSQFLVGGTIFRLAQLWFWDCLIVGLLFLELFDCWFILVHSSGLGLFNCWVIIGIV
jgi:hypothetical protein